MDTLITPEEAIRQGAASLISYGKIFFPKTFRQESPTFHLEISNLLYSKDRYVALMIFRDGAKTTLLRTYLSQRIAYGLSRTIYLVSASQDHSIHSVRWIKRQITYNKAWADLFMLSKGDKWTDEIISIDNKFTGTTITIMAGGITGQIRGFNIDDHRPDLIVADDIQTEENVGTAAQITKTSQLFFGALANSLAPATESPLAKLALLQTPMTRGDIIDQCVRNPQWTCKQFGILDEDGKSRWEARYPTETLLKAKQDAIRAGLYQIWMKEKECQIVSGERQLFDVTKVKYWTELPKDIITFIAVDPASSDSKTADDNVVMVVGFHNSDVYVVAYEAAQGVMPDVATAQILNYIIQYRPRQIIIETVAYQKTLQWFVEREMQQKRIFCPVNGFKERRSKYDRIIQSITPLLSYGRLYISKGMGKLLSQLNAFDVSSTEHDDVVDALAIAITNAPSITNASSNSFDIEPIEDIDFTVAP